MVHPLPQSSEYVVAAKKYHQISSSLKYKQYCIPGNHDIGDKPSKWVPTSETKNKSLVKFIRNFGPDYQSFTHKNCKFILLNAQIFNSSLPERTKQKNWLLKQLKGCKATHTFIAIHYPPFLLSPDEVDHYDNLANPDRDWFLSLIREHSVTAVLSGHVHNFWFNVWYVRPYNCAVTSFVRQDFSEMYTVKSPNEVAVRI